MKRGEILALGPMSCMDFQRAPMDPADAARAFAGRLAEADLPCFASAAHDIELDLLKVTWTHGVALYMDLTRQGFDEPIDAYSRAVILGLRPCCDECATRDETDRGSDASRTEIPIPEYGQSSAATVSGTAPGRLANPLTRPGRTGTSIS